MSDLTKECKCTMDYEAECERLSMIIMQQKETIHALTMANYNLTNAMVQIEKEVWNQ